MSRHLIFFLSYSRNMLYCMYLLYVPVHSNYSIIVLNVFWYWYSVYLYTCKTNRNFKDNNTYSFSLLVHQHTWHYFMKAMLVAELVSFTSLTYINIFTFDLRAQVQCSNKSKKMIDFSIHNNNSISYCNE